LGGIFGIIIARKWGGFKSLIGRAIIMFAIGLILQELGQLIYTYYIYFLHVEVPYPSLGDVGYFGSIPFYILGILSIAKAAGTKVRFKSVNYKLVVVLLPFVLLAVGYMLFLEGYTFDWNNPIKILLDFGYPFGKPFISL